MPQEIVYIQRDEFRPWFTGAVIAHVFLFLFNAVLFIVDLNVLLTDTRPLSWKVTPLLLACYYVSVLLLIPVALSHMHKAKKMKLWHIAVMWYPLLFFACATLWVWLDSLDYMGLLNFDL